MISVGPSNGLSKDSRLTADWVQARQSEDGAGGPEKESHRRRSAAFVRELFGGKKREKSDASSVKQDAVPDASSHKPRK